MKGFTAPKLILRDYTRIRALLQAARARALDAPAAVHCRRCLLPPSPPQLHQLQVAARVPGAAVSPPVDFLIPGLEGLHFVAYGCSRGTVVIACARQVAVWVLECWGGKVLRLVWLVFWRLLGLCTSHLPGQAWQFNASLRQQCSVSPRQTSSTPPGGAPP